MIRAKKLIKLGFIFIIFIVTLIVISGKRQSIDKKKLDFISLNTKDITIPIFPDAKQIDYLKLKNSPRNYREIRYMVYLPHLSKQLFDFYSREFSKLGYISVQPKNYPYKNKLGEWQIGYFHKDLKDLQKKEKAHAQLDFFWFDSKGKVAFGLFIFYDFNGQIELKETENKNIQYVNIGIINFFENETLDTIDIYKLISGYGENI